MKRAPCLNRRALPLVDSPQWIIENGIGEARALLMQAGEVLAAKLYWPGEIVAGDIHGAILTEKRGGARRGTVTLENGGTALVDQLPSDLTEGANGQVRITRAPIAERGRLKRAQSRWVGGNLPDQEAGGKGIFETGKPVPKFAASDWEEVWHAASSGTIAFAGGEILCSVTPAMTVIDIDGDMPPRELAMAAIPAVVQALHWFGIGGNVGIDFPTLQTKSDRRAVDTALANALSGWPHESTAMNGFGFVQLIARLEGPSLLHRFATSRTALCARAAMRTAERVEGAGATLITIHPALKSKIKPEWLDELRRRTGREVRIETDAGLALEAPHAQIVSL